MTENGRLPREQNDNDDDDESEDLNKEWKSI